jgi:isopentenyl-diphosphate delta-isomerase
MNIEKVVLVNDRDEVTGLAGKLEAHEKGLLHRAISVVLFQKEDPRLMLVQQRAAVKYHSPLLWANTCCSHPRDGEAPEAAAIRRVREELGIVAPPLTFAGAVQYRAEVPPGLVEHEISHVFAGFLSKDAAIPRVESEVTATDWIDAGDWPTDRKYVPWIGKMVYKALALGISPVHKDIIKKHEAAA